MVGRHRLQGGWRRGRHRLWKGWRFRRHRFHEAFVVGRHRPYVRFHCGTIQKIYIDFMNRQQLDFLKLSYNFLTKSHYIKIYLIQTQHYYCLIFMDFTKVFWSTDYIEVYFILGDHFTSPDILPFNHFVWNKIKILLYISSVYIKPREIVSHCSKSQSMIFFHTKNLDKGKGRGKVWDEPETEKEEKEIKKDVLKAMNFDHDFGYSFPLFSSLLKKTGKKKRRMN